MKTLGKKIWSLTLLLVACLFVSCSNDIQELQENGLKKLNFTVLNYEQVMLDDVTRAATLPHLVMAVYDEDGAVVKKIAQEGTEKSFGTFSVELPFGTYNVVFVGYDKDYELDFSDPEAVAFAGNEVPHVFCASMELEVEKNTSSVNPVTLARCVSRFELVIQDALPTTLGNFTVTIEKGGESFNALTGLCKKANGRVKTFNLAPYAGNRESTTIGIYCFLESESVTTNIKAQAFDISDVLIKEQNFTDVPLKINQLTRYKGSFFVPTPGTAGFTVTLPTSLDWTNKSEVDY